jgi:hypothetical protein
MRYNAAAKKTVKGIIYENRILLLESVKHLPPDKRVSLAQES